MPDEVDALDPRRAVRYAAQENSVHRSPASLDGGVDRAPVSEIHLDGLDSRQLHRCPVHHHHLGPGVLHQLGDRRPHAGGAAHNQGPLAVVPERLEHSHAVSFGHRAGCADRSVRSCARRSRGSWRPPQGRGAPVRLSSAIMRPASSQYTRSLMPMMNGMSCATTSTEAPSSSPNPQHQWRERLRLTLGHASRRLVEAQEAASTPIRHASSTMRRVRSRARR